MSRIRDLHIREIIPLISPVELKRKYPSSPGTVETVIQSREIIKKILRREDPRILGIVGPCSIHDPEAAFEYAEKLKNTADRISDKIFVIMRVYFEKPRTTVGWRGLILDPHIDGTYDVSRGLELGREIMTKIVKMGLPIGSEMLDPIIPQYIDDLVSWAAIGARTTESQTHRNLASGLSIPVGFKNATSGSLDPAVNAMEAARSPASFIGIDQEGKTSIFRTSGNDCCHIILRGGRSGPNYHDEDIEDAEALMHKAGLFPSIVVDCSHSNSGKTSIRQGRVLRSVVNQVNRREKSLVGFMLESNLFEGCQEIRDDIKSLEYGISITDECLGWEETEKLLMEAYQEVKI